jgi:uncharacterized membrane protein
MLPDYLVLMLKQTLSASFCLLMILSTTFQLSFALLILFGSRTNRSTTTKFTSNSKVHTSDEYSRHPSIVTGSASNTWLYKHGCVLLKIKESQ